MPPEADAFGLSVVEDINRIAIDRSDHLAGKLPCESSPPKQSREQDCQTNAHELHANRLPLPWRGPYGGGLSCMRIRKVTNSDGLTGAIPTSQITSPFPWSVSVIMV
jgi:hypothetical protein